MKALIALPPVGSLAISVPAKVQPFMEGSVAPVTYAAAAIIVPTAGVIMIAIAVNVPTMLKGKNALEI